MPALANQESTLALSHALSLEGREGIDNPQEWVSINDAARLLGMSARHVRRLAAASLARGLSRLAPPADAPGKPVCWLHRSIHARLGVPAPDTREARARDTLLSRFPRHDVERAYRKTYWMKEWRSRLTVPRLAGRTAARIAAEIVTEAKQHEGADFLISVSSLRVWWSAYNEIDDDGQIRGVEMLVDRYGDGGSGESSRSAAAIEFFYKVFRVLARPGIRYCHSLVLHHAKREGWLWPRSYSATRAWLVKEDDIPFTHLCRYGWREYAHRYMPYEEQDWELVEPGQFYVADHHQCDFWVTFDKKLIRPWLTAVQDCRSRRIVGWRIGAAPHQEAILLAMRMAFHEGVPEVMRIDNGKDFKSKVITGITKDGLRRIREELREQGFDWKKVLRRRLLDCDDVRWKGMAAELDIKLIFAIPYSPWSKGTLERWFGTFEAQHGKTYPTYCGNTPANRPECLPDILKGAVLADNGRFKLRDGSCVPTLVEVREGVADYLTIYEHSPHAGRGIEDKTPHEVWISAEKLRKAEEEGLDFLLSIRGLYKVGANGVSLMVGGTRLTYGAGSAALRAWTGRKVLVSVDPEWPQRCVAIDPDNRRFIAALQPNKGMHPLADIDILRASRHKTEGLKKAARRGRDAAPRSMLTAVQVMNQAMREQAAEFRATGTDDARPNIAPVRCGFEGQSRPVQSTVDAIPDEYAKFDFSQISFADPPPAVDAPDDPYAKVDLSQIGAPDDEEADGS